MLMALGDFFVRRANAPIVHFLSTFVEVAPSEALEPLAAAVASRVAHTNEMVPIAEYASVEPYSKAGVAAAEMLRLDPLARQAVNNTTILFSALKARIRNPLGFIAQQAVRKIRDGQRLNVAEEFIKAARALQLSSPLALARIRRLSVPPALRGMDTIKERFGYWGVRIPSDVDKALLEIIEAVTEFCANLATALLASTYSEHKS
jgi:hypothetical protein